MARSNRRDCRTGDRKKNNMNKRVEGMQKAIRKAKKEGDALPDGAPAAAASSSSSSSGAAPAAAAELSTSASAFLAQMRADATASVGQMRDDAATRSAASKARQAPS